MPHTLLLLGPPSLAALQASSEPLLDHVLPAFDPAPGQIRLEDYYGSAPLPTISTFDPDETPDAAIKAPLDKTKDAGRDGLVVNRERHAQAAQAGRWRFLPLEKGQLHTGFTQRSYMITPEARQTADNPSSTNPGDETSFIAFNGSEQSVFLSLDYNHQSDASQHDGGPTSSALLEHSFAAHNVPTSQLSISTSPSKASTSYDDFSTEIYIQTPNAAVSAVLPHIPMSSLLELEDLPSAAELATRQKLLVTSLLVGIVGMTPARIIATRNRNENNPSGLVSLITVTVGDESASGFEIKVWVSLAEGVVNPVALLKRGDIVLFDRIGLTTFRGRVFGSTLHGDRTRVVLAYRDDGRGARLDGRELDDDQQVVKVRQMRDWVRNFVGVEVDRGEGAHDGHDGERSFLPADTPESAVSKVIRR